VFPLFDKYYISDANIEKTVWLASLQSRSWTPPVPVDKADFSKQLGNFALIEHASLFKYLHINIPGAR